MKRKAAACILIECLAFGILGASVATISVAIGGVLIAVGLLYAAYKIERL